MKKETTIYGIAIVSVITLLSIYAYRQYRDKKALEFQLQLKEL